MSRWNETPKDITGNLTKFNEIPPKLKTAKTVRRRPKAIFENVLAERLIAFDALSYSSWSIVGILILTQFFLMLGLNYL